MSLVFVLGNLLGRILVSYLLVWIILFLGSRLDWRLAFTRSKRWYNLLLAVLLGVLGLGAAVVRSGGVS
jgi:hypothetical protein